MLVRMFSYLILEPIRKRRLSLFVWRLSQILHTKTNGKSDIFIRDLIIPFRPKVGFPPSRLFPDVDISKLVKDIHQDGYTVCPVRLPVGLVQAIQDFAATTPSYDAGGQRRWTIQEQTAAPALQAILCESFFPVIAQEYLGGHPLLCLPHLTLDQPTPTRRGAHRFHYDNGGPAFLNFFFYLSDVTEKSGPHSYIRGSHSKVKPRQFAQGGSVEDSRILAHYGQENQVVHTGPAGTIIIEDTMGFHKGAPVMNGFRLMLQLVYTLVDIPDEEEWTVGIQKHKVAGLDTSLRKVLRKYYS